MFQDFMGEYEIEDASREGKLFALGVDHVCRALPSNENTVEIVFETEGYSSMFGQAFQVGAHAASVIQHAAVGLLASGIQDHL
jgi:hypothetical protein